jgi:hypothetical protein
MDKERLIGIKDNLTIEESDNSGKEAKRVFGGISKPF